MWLLLYLSSFVDRNIMRCVTVSFTINIIYSHKRQTGSDYIISLDFSHQHLITVFIQKFKKQSLQMNDIFKLNLSIRKKKLYRVTNFLCLGMLSLEKIIHFNSHYWVSHAFRLAKTNSSTIWVSLGNHSKSSTEFKFFLCLVANGRIVNLDSWVIFSKGLFQPSPFLLAIILQSWALHLEYRSWT